MIIYVYLAHHSVAAHQCTEDTLALCDGGHLLQRELSKAQLT